MTDEKLVTAAERLRTVAADLKAASSALLEAIDAAEACGLEITDLDRNVIQTRMVERFPYMLERKATSLMFGDKGAAL